ncbi:uncharacterized protein [Dysidea avara]|uniref:uncharacterized protein isoform X1 n=1 Tax=Dysidea avara TaxID=196820 RepID=UPI00332B7205
MWRPNTVIFGEEPVLENQASRPKRRRLIEWNPLDRPSGCGEDSTELPGEKSLDGKEGPLQAHDVKGDEQAEVNSVRGEGKRKSTQPNAASNTVQPQPSESASSLSSTAGRKQKALNKKEKLRITDHLGSLKPEVVTTVSLNNMQKLLPSYNSELKQFCTSVIPNQLKFLSEHLQKVFIRLYEECSTLKERYLQFQIRWHRYCSYLLVKNCQLSPVGLHPTDPLAIEVVAVWSKWNKFCSLHSLLSSESKKFLIVFCSCVYDELLRQCHIAVQADRQKDIICLEDTEDIYYRFGGATLCSMLHRRYDKIKVCSSQQNVTVSLELTLLQYT